MLLSNHRPYQSINSHDVRLKSSAIPLWSLIGAEGQEMCECVSIGLLSLWIQQDWCVCVCVPPREDKA